MAKTADTVSFLLPFGIGSKRHTTFFILHVSYFQNFWKRRFIQLLLRKIPRVLIEVHLAIERAVVLSTRSKLWIFAFHFKALVARVLHISPVWTLAVVGLVTFYSRSLFLWREIKHDILPRQFQQHRIIKELVDWHIFGQAFPTACFDHKLAG